MFNLSLQWLVVALDVSVKAVLLAALAAVVLRLLRLRDTNLRHRTWTGVLIGMLLLPGLSQTVPRLQLPFAIPDHWRIGEWDNGPLVDAPAPERTATSELLTIPEPLPPLDAGESFGERSHAMPGWMDHGLFARSDFGSEEEATAADPVLQTVESVPPAAADVSREDSEPASIGPAPVERSRPPRWPVALLGLWLAGTGLMALRLLAGFACSLRLARSSTAITANELTELGVAPRVLADDGRPVPTWECPLIRVPLALGIVRPRILLPSEWPAWPAEKLQAVIAHERTHIERADGTVIFLAELNRCLYWFHPLAWWLRGHLGRLAEIACDDAAIDCTGDRTSYARHLLEVAGSVSGHRSRIITAGISMARPSNVESRINSILDFTRPLSQRLTWTTTLLLLGMLIPLITLAAAVRPSTATKTQPASEQAASEDDSTAADGSIVDSDQPNEIDESATKREDTPTAVSYSGRIETSDGVSIAGAAIWLSVRSYVSEVEGVLQELGRSDEHGRFRVVIDAATAAAIAKRVPFGHKLLVVRMASRGLDWMPLEVFEDNPAPSDKRDRLQARIDKALGAGQFASRTLKLRPEERPIRGRLLDLDGRPLPSVRVLVEELRQPDLPLLLKAFEESSKDGVYAALNATGVGVGGLGRGELQKLIPPVITDKNGEFELSGIGEDQLVTLSFDADRVEARTLHVLGRDIETVSLPHIPLYPNGAKDVYVGRDFTYAIGPSVPVEGVVKDFDTGEPVANTLVYVERLFRREGFDEQVQLRLDTHHMRAVTDEHGRFRITGMPPGEGHVLEAMPPKGEPYLMASQDVSTSLDDGDAKEIEIQVKKGIWIDGQVTDKQSSEPISASVDYLALQKNPHTLDKLGLRQAWVQQRYWTDSEGRYRVPGLPGPGVLLVVSQNGKGYPKAAGAESIDGYQASNGYIPTTPTGLPVSNWHLLKPIDPAADATSFTCDLALDAGVTVLGHVVGPDGKPVADVSVLGETANDAFWKPRTGGEFTIEGYDGEGPRQLFFKTADDALVGQFRLEGDAPEEIVVRLQPAVRVTGRLLENENELPAARYTVHCVKSSLFSEKYPRTTFRIDDCHTDDEGRFEITGLIAGIVYKMNAANERHFVNNRNRFTIDLTDAQAGDVIELGDVTGPNSTQPMKRVQPNDEAEATGDSMPPTSGPPEAPANLSALADVPDQPQSESSICSGTVVDANGQPVAGAHVAVIAWRTQPRQGGDLSPGGAVLAKGTSDASGQYRLTLSDVSEKTHTYAYVIARTDGMAMAWDNFDLDASRTESKLKLQPEEPIRGRLIDIDGHPGDGVELSVMGVMKATNGEPATDGVAYRGGREVPAAWVPALTSAEQGTFTIRGVPAGYGVYLIVKGNDRFAPQEISLNTGMPEHRGERDATYRALTRNVEPDEEALLPLAPAQVFQGNVRYEDTGEPTPHARLTIWASQQEQYGSMTSVEGQADADGRYRITPKPGVRFGINAYPPKGVPYLPRHTPTDQAIRWEATERVKHVDVTLPRGVLVRGQVLESVPGNFIPEGGRASASKPVPGASIQYIPERVNNDFDSDDILTGWQGIQVSDEDGRFEIAVLPGPGRLLVHGPGWKYVLQEIGDRELSRNRPGGQRNYAHAIVKIDPEPNAGVIDRAIELQPGRSVSGRIVNERGEPIEEAVLVTRLAISPHTTFWRGSDLFKARNGRFELNGLAADQEYPVHFLDAKHRLGATTLLSPTDEETAIVLRECGQAKMRFVDDEDQPVADHYPTVEIVVTPGEYRYDGEAFRLGKLAADSDFISNTDQLNYPNMPKSDERGEVVLPALIPGATYQVVLRRGQLFDIAKTFVAETGETLDLGDIVVEPSE